MKINWDKVVLLLAIANGLYIPLKLTFDPPEMNTTFFIFGDWVVDVIFVIDIILGFFVSFVDIYGQETFSYGEIAKNNIV